MCKICIVTQDKKIIFLLQNYYTFINYKFPSFIDEISMKMGEYDNSTYTLHRNKWGGVYVNSSNNFTGEITDDLEHSFFE